MSTGVASVCAHELLRTALLAKLAVDLQDPRLARRAAREALAQARLLSGLDFLAYEDEDDPTYEDDQADEDAAALADVAQVLLLAYLPAGDDEGEAA